MRVARQSLSDGKLAFEVQCYKVCERFHIIEVRDVARDKVELLQQYMTAVAQTSTKRVYAITERIVGSKNANRIVTSVGEKMPVVTAVINTEKLKASTGSNDDTSSSGTPPETGSPVADPA